MDNMTSDNRLGVIQERLERGERLPFYFKMRMVRSGPFVAAKVTRACNCTVNGEDGHEWTKTCDRYPKIISEVNGNEYDLQRLLKGGQLRSIDEKEFNLLRDTADWDRQHDPGSALASPTKSINYGKMKPPF